MRRPACPPPPQAFARPSGDALPFAVMEHRPTCASSPSPSRARPTTICWRWRGAPSSSATARSSAATTTWRWAALRAARPDRRVGDARRAGPRDVDDPPRHARHVGDVPPPRPARDLAWPRSTRCRAGVSTSVSVPVGTRRSTTRTASRSRRSGERFDRLEEQLAIITGMWATPTGETFESPGGHYPITASPALPKPVQSPLPIIIGGGGPKRTPALAATVRRGVQHPVRRPSSSSASSATVCRAACEAIDRDPATMTFSAALVLCCGADDAEVERRAAAIGRDAAELRAERCGRHARRGRRHARPLARRRGGTHLPPGARPRRPRPPRPRRHRRRPAPRLTRRQPLEVCGRHVDRGTVEVSATNRRSGICGRHVDAGPSRCLPQTSGDGVGGYVAGMSEITVFPARTVVTMDPAQPMVEAVAVRDGRVLAAGSIEECASWGPHTVDRRFADHVIVPGMIEAHAHTLEGAFALLPYVGWFDRHRVDGGIAPRHPHLRRTARPAARARRGNGRLQRTDRRRRVRPDLLPIRGAARLVNTSTASRSNDRSSCSTPAPISPRSTRRCSNATQITRDATTPGVARDANGEPNGELQEMPAMALAASGRPDPVPCAQRPCGDRSARPDLRQPGRHDAVRPRRVGHRTP